MVDYKELVGGGGDELSLAHSDPIVLEFNRLQNQLKGLSLSLSLFLSASLSRVFFPGFLHRKHKGLFRIGFLKLGLQECHFYPKLSRILVSKIP